MVIDSGKILFHKKPKKMDVIMENNYKGLVIAHNPLSRQTNNGKTYASLLSNFCKEQLCQIYVTNLEPNFELAGSFYKICEKAVIWNRRETIGGEVFKDNLPIVVSKNKPNSTRVVRKCKKKMQTLTYTLMGQAIRSWMWGEKSLLNDDLRSWIVKEKPDFVFWGNGNVCAMIKLAIQICEEYDLPLIANLGDDYFSRGYTANIIYDAYQKKLKQVFGEIAKRAEVITVCSDKMAYLLKRQFGGTYFIALNSVERSEQFEIKDIDEHALTMVYTGNVGIGRWKTLVQVGKALNKLQTDWNISLDIYSGEALDDKIVKSLNRYPDMKLHDAVYGKELHKIRQNADVMLFVETFERKHKRLLETAVSTKVPEYLNTKRAILAVGPEYSASIDYFKRNDVSVVINSKSEAEIVRGIRELVESDNKRIERIKRGYMLVEKEHLREVNASKMEEYIVEGIEKKKLGRKVQ